MNPSTIDDSELTGEAFEHIDALLRHPDEATVLRADEWMGRSEAHLQRFEECTQLLNALRAPGIADALPLPTQTTTPPLAIVPDDAVPALATDRFRLSRTRERVTRWRFAAVFVPIACGALLATWYAGRPIAHQALASSEVIHLRDGSTLVLMPHSQITEDFGRRSREVYLREGGLASEVAHDAARPYRVHAGAARIEALGTQFNVLLRPDGRVSVALDEGTLRVDAQDPSGKETSATLTSGQFTEVSPDGHIAAIQATGEAQRTPQWRKFQHTTLVEIAAVFNALNSAVQLEIGSDVAERRYNANLDMTDSRALIHWLEGDEALTLQRRPGFITVHAAAAHR